jgi:hypothetical protein
MTTPASDAIAELEAKLAGIVDKAGAVLDRLRAGQTGDTDVWSDLTDLAYKGWNAATALEDAQVDDLDLPEPPPPARPVVPMREVETRLAAAITKSLRARWPNEVPIRTKVSFGKVRQRCHIQVYCPAELATRWPVELDAAVAVAVDHPIRRDAHQSVIPVLPRGVPGPRRPGTHVHVHYNILEIATLTAPYGWS